MGKTRVVIARSEATKQSRVRIADWIASLRFASLEMTILTSAVPAATFDVNRQEQ
jgi:hypothetical protein